MIKTNYLVGFWTAGCCDEYFSLFPDVLYTIIDETVGRLTNNDSLQRQKKPYEPYSTFKSVLL